MDIEKRKLTLEEKNDVAMLLSLMTKRLKT